MKIRLTGCVLAGLLMAWTGCTTNYTTRIPQGRGNAVECLTSASLRYSGRKYEVLGQVHAERWKPTLWWSSADANGNRSQGVFADIQEEARKMGADAVVDVLPRVENHYEFAIVLIVVPFVFCHDEIHTGATAIRYID